jgi:deoxyribodipyrimidine photo-lyase
MHASDSDLRHIRFASQSLQDMTTQKPHPDLKQRLVQGERLDVLPSLQARRYEITLYSHMEVGTQRTFQREKEVKKWCAQHDVVRREFKNFGVDWGRKHRLQWANHWLEWMECPLAQSDYTQALPAQDLDLSEFEPLPNLLHEWGSGLSRFQPGGTSNAYRYMEGFFNLGIPSYASSYFKTLSRPHRLQPPIGLPRVGQCVSEASVA